MSSEAASDRSIGGVLSRSSVYTTLRSLDTASTTTTTADGDAATIASSSTKKLLQFYSKLSTAHHHRLSERLDGKNTAGRPLSATDVASRLETRGLTLTGGGYNSAITSSSKSQREGATTTAAAKLSQRQRKRQRRAILRRIGGASSTAEGGSTGDDPNLQFLLQLNAHWNQYMSKLLSLEDYKNSLISSDESNIQTLTRKVQLMANEIEWIGARVQVSRGTTSSNTMNQQLSGILVSQTERTWRVVPLPLTFLSKNKDDTTTEIDNNIPKSMRLPRTRTVPKQKGSSLAVLIPLPREEKEGASSSRRYLKVILQPPSP